jgi:hypothetical protein
MNNKPIAEAHDDDLRLSEAAMNRAAQRAHELALRTGTAVVVSHHGVLQEIRPIATIQPLLTAQEPLAPFDGQR